MQITEKIDNYLVTEKMSQMFLRKKFNFLKGIPQDRIVMDLWQYLNPASMSPASVVFSKEKTFTDEMIKRMNLDSYSEYISDKQMELMVKTIKSLNLDRQWDYDSKRKAFVSK